MNCKQGDLAVLVNARLETNIGKFVEILEPIGFFCKNQTFEKNGTIWRATRDGFYWWAEAATTLTSSNTFGVFKQMHVEDSCLRPLRDNPGQDETLTWAPVPKKVEA